jgi:hypothetical protein
MSTIQFDESQFKLRSYRVLGSPEVPVMIKVLVTKGIVKTEKQAIGVLLSFIFVLICVTFLVFNTNGTEPAILDKEYTTL